MSWYGVCLGVYVCTDRFGCPVFWSLSCFVPVPFHPVPSGSYVDSPPRSAGLSFRAGTIPRQKVSQQGEEGECVRLSNFLTVLTLTSLTACWEASPTSALHVVSVDLCLRPCVRAGLSARLYSLCVSLPALSASWGEGECTAGGARRGFCGSQMFIGTSG